MRKLIFLLKTSCYVLSVLFTICIAHSNVYSQQAAEPADPAATGVPADIYISVPYKKLITSDIAGLKKNSGKIPAPDCVRPPDSATFALKKNDSLAIKDTSTMAIVSLPPAKTQKTDVTEGDEPSAYDDEIAPVLTKYAEMISLDPMELDNFPLYKFIDGWYGTRYKFGGTDNTGIDCSAFSQRLYGDVYNTSILRTSRQQHRISEPVEYEEATEGDLIFFRMHRLRISHVGVYLANGYFVHASRTHGVVISSLDDKYWHRRFAGCGRIEKPERQTSESGLAQ